MYEPIFGPVSEKVDLPVERRSKVTLALGGNLFPPLPVARIIF